VTHRSTVELKNFQIFIRNNTLFLLILLISCGRQNSAFRYSPIDATHFEIARQAEQKALSRGKEIWFDQKIGENDFSCHSCHEGGFLTNPDKYPRYKHPFRSYATFSMANNFAVVNENKGKPWVLGSEDANALVLYMTSLANGKSIRLAAPDNYKKDWVTKGLAAFQDRESGLNEKSCETCHIEGGRKKNIVDNKVIPGLKGSAARYPQYNDQVNKIIILEQQINLCLEKNLAGHAIPLDDELMVALTTYITWLSEGYKISVASLPEKK
jgi:thiosulfate dehydrogenase